MDASQRQTWLRAALPLSLLLTLLLARSAAAAETAAAEIAATETAAVEIAAVAVDASADVENARAMQVLTLQALQSRGFATLDPPALQGRLSPEEALPLAADSGAARLFVLHLAPLDVAVVASLSEVSVTAGTSQARASLVIDTPEDADRAISRLVDAVVDGVPLEETARIATLTEHEGRAFSKRPGEFLWGLTLSSAFGMYDGAGSEDAPAIWGGSLRFLYEIEHAQFGVSLGGAGAEDGGMFDLSVRGHWLILDQDISPYVGGGLGVSVLGFTGLDLDYGGHAVLSGGVEFFRLHAARLVASVDVMLPFYRLGGGDRWIDGQSVDTAPTWTPLFLIGVGVLW